MRRNNIIQIITIFLFFAVQIFCVSVLFSVTKNLDEVRELGGVESPDGLVQVKLLVIPSQPRLSDTIILRLEVISDAQVKVDLPEFGDSMGKLKILGTSENVKAILDGKEQKILEIKTIPTQAGTTPIWSIPITYYDRQTTSQDKKKEVVLNMTSLEINSDITPESASLDKIVSGYEIFGQGDNRFWRIVAAAAVLILLIILSIIWIRRRYKKPEPELQLSPQEIANRRIAELIDGRLYEADVKLFFVELSGIVRWYIEQQTLIRAPELTTEEFLKKIYQNRQLYESHLKSQQQNNIKNNLQINKQETPDENANDKNSIEDQNKNSEKIKLFLESADMIKFAKFKPNQEEIKQGIKYAIDLINTDFAF
ncbi:MAG: hypothetical protein LBP59_19795 [Planctomycetaceae bacterium]|jgi:hypothetical protein|nr:hypothetical protein [Planctomycetaceae bacterium]